MAWLDPSSKYNVWKTFKMSNSTRTRTQLVSITSKVGSDIDQNIDRQELVHFFVFCCAFYKSPFVSNEETLERINALSSDKTLLTILTIFLIGPISAVHNKSPMYVLTLTLYSSKIITFISSYKGGSSRLAS